MDTMIEKLLLTCGLIFIVNLILGLVTQESRGLTRFNEVLLNLFIFQVCLYGASLFIYALYKIWM